jgi:general secretion pathway protein G
MKRLLKKSHHGNKGFTLMGLAIVIGIIGTLSAVVLPNISGLTGAAEIERAKPELVTIQTAVDIMMAKDGLFSLTATPVTNNMAAFPDGKPLYPNYLQTAQSKGTYSCDSTGLVTQITTGFE